MEPYIAILMWHEGGWLRWSERMAWVPDDESAIRFFKDQAAHMSHNRKVSCSVDCVRKGKRTVFNG